MALNDLIQLAGIGVLKEVEENAAVAGPRRYHHHRRDDPFNDLRDREFVRGYRLNKERASNLVDLLSPLMVAPSRLSDLSIETKVLIALRFFASGSYQLDVGSSVNQAVSQSSISRSIEEVSNALNEAHIFNQFVGMPRNNQELEKVYRGFHVTHDFPRLIGCLDCTHVAIYPPDINHPLYPQVIYVNRKGYHSSNVQLICASDLRILNVCARYPGGTHDGFIWNNSAVLPYMQNLHRNGRRLVLLADSGYALRPWILTPVADAAPNTPESAYNERQISTRSVIERCNGVLKLRFRCLLRHRVLCYKPEKCSKIVNACVVLHNLCIDNNLPPVEDANHDVDAIDFGMYPPEPDELPDGEPKIRANRVNPDLVAGRLFRVRFIRNHFGR